jgi:restriction system protein
MDKYNAEFGIFITTADFTCGAVKAARHENEYINWDKICNLVAKYRYYVEPVITYCLKSFYSEND